MSKIEQAQAEAERLVAQLRKTNRAVEKRTGVATLPEEEYRALEKELTRKLLRHAA